jgi:radial spoke head protein 4A
LSDLIRRIIDEKPENVIDYFEEFSLKVKLERRQKHDENFEVQYESPKVLPWMQKVTSMLKNKSKEPEPEEEEQESEDSGFKMPQTFDVMQLQNLWRSIGVALPCEDLFLLAYSMERLKKRDELKNCRFWGLLYGLRGNYYVVEGDWDEDALEKQNVCPKHSIKLGLLLNFKFFSRT